MPVFERSLELDAPREAVFRFHLDTRNAALIAPRGVEVEVVEGAFPLVAGAEVDLRIRQRPLPRRLAVRWRLRVRALAAPSLVVDEQLAGPFGRFVHEHRFADLGGGRTRLTDRIDLALPGGPLGQLAWPLVLPLMHLAFGARQRATARLLARGGDEPAPGRAPPG